MEGEAIDTHKVFFISYPQILEAQDYLLETEEDH